MGLNLKELVELKKESMVGLDIGSASVKAVHLKPLDKGYSVVSACDVETAIVPEDDDAMRSAKKAAAVRGCFNTNQFQTRQVICGVSGPEVAVRPFSFPVLPEAELPEAVMLEAEQVCPFDARSNVVDFQVVNAGDDTKSQDQQMVSGVLVAATKEVIRQKAQMVSGVNLNCAMMDVEGLALANCFEQIEEIKDGEAVAILNIGAASTNIVILEKSGLPFVRDISHGGDAIINQIALEHNTSRAQVMTILAGGEGRHKEEINASLGKASGKLISDINESLRYYLIERRAGAISKVYVCGGFSQVEGLCEMLESQINCRVEIWNPFAKLTIPNVGLRSTLEKSGPAFAVAAGLAMRTI